MKIRLVLSVMGLAAAAVGTRAANAGGREAHVLVLDGSSYATNVDIDELVGIRQANAGDYLWFRRGGRRYVVTDPGVLAAGRDILRPVRALSEEQEELSARLRPFEDREEALDREEERLEDRSDKLEGRHDRASEEERERLDALQREIDEKQRALDAETRGLDAEERRLDDREREVEAMADAQVARLIEDALRRGLARSAK